MRNILLIAGHQFQDILKEPFVLMVVGFISFILLLNAAACATTIPQIDEDSSYVNDPFFTQGLSNPMLETAELLSVISIFIGLLTIAEERSGGSLRVLITKPIYRRDLLAGKYLGISMLLLLITIFMVMLCVSTVVIFSRPPVSTDELILRTISYILVLFLSCELTLGISMLIGVVLKNIFSILISTAVFLCLNWTFEMPQFLADFTYFIFPGRLFCYVISGGGSTGSLFRTTYTYGQWLNGALPYIALMIVEILLIILVSSYLFSIDEQ